MFWANTRTTPRSRSAIAFRSGTATATTCSSALNVVWAYRSNTAKRTPSLSMAHRARSAGILGTSDGSYGAAAVKAMTTIGHGVARDAGK